MTVVTVRVERDPDQQPTWAQNFFRSEMAEPQKLVLAALLYADRTVSAARIVQSLTSKFPVFNPHVTVTFTDDHFFEFTWASEAEQTMFLLKWS